MAVKYRFLLLYGSQTGQAKTIAENIRDRCSDHVSGLEADLHYMNEWESGFHLSRERCVVVVTSSTGDGDPPDNAGKMVRALKRRTLAKDYLSGVHYSVLGLGDTNYTNFCNCPKTVDKRMEELGAQRFFPSAWADDAVGLETVVEPFIDGLIPRLVTFLSQEISSDSTNCVNDAERDSLTENGDVPEGAKKDAVVSKTSEIDGISSSLATLSLPSETSPLLGDDQLSLTGVEVTCPVLPASSLDISFDHTIIPSITELDSLPHQNGAQLPSSRGPLINARLVSLTLLTRSGALKTAYRATLDLGPSAPAYHPGDSIGVICPNPPQEIDQLLARLDVSTDEADCSCRLTLSQAGKSGGRRVRLGDHLPVDQSGPVTLRWLLTRCVDLRHPLSKVALRMLAEHCLESRETRRLLELASAQGRELYSKCIRESDLSVLDILTWFPSCKPPIGRLIEMLPRLQPRPYSLACSPLAGEPGHVTFVFNRVDINAAAGRTYERTGVCTGWLERLWRAQQTPDAPLSAVNVFFRKNLNGFRPPDDFMRPMILIGPGTGSAPFIGFLEHRLAQKKAQPSLELAPIWLFYGCRNRELDYIFREEFERFLSAGVLTHLCLCFSRDNTTKSSDLCLPGGRYVQDCLRHHAKEMCQLVQDPGETLVLVCGDARGMAPDVFKSWVQVVAEGSAVSTEDAQAVVQTMRLKRLYVEDVWT